MNEPGKWKKSRDEEEERRKGRDDRKRLGDAMKRSNDEKR